MGNKMGSLLTKSRKLTKVNKFGFHAFSMEDDDDDQVYFTPKSYPSDETDDDDGYVDFRRDSFPSDSDTDETPSFVCEFCVEQTPLRDSFNLKGCNHFYCIQCTIRYVASKLDDNILSIHCPVSDCKGVLEPDYCRDILPQDVFDRWGKALCESAIVGSEKFYCPYKDCSALLISNGGVKLTDSVCPSCHRLFCVQCKVPWHSEFDCKKFQKLKKRGDDAMLVDIAKKNKWRRCPKCKIYVEKTEGCFYMKCRCGYAFCYNCGARSSTTSHCCPKCKH